MGVAVPYESKSRAEPAKMKFLAVLLLVALAYAEPEAAPDAEADAEAAPWYYGYYGHPGYYGGWGGYYGRRWGGYYGWGGYPYAYGYWKRDAEQQQPDQMVKREAEEEEAKPAMLYAGYYGHYPTTLHYGVAGYPYAHHPYALAHPAVTYAAPVAPTVAVKPYTYYANSGGAVHIVKRDAEAKPEAEAEASPRILVLRILRTSLQMGRILRRMGWILWTTMGIRILGLNPLTNYFHEINFTKFFVKSISRNFFVKSISRNLTRKM